jgi:chondroitin sulfate proteoglycan 4
VAKIKKRTQFNIKIVVNETVLTPSQVMHPYIPASDITYLVVEPPLYGYLEVLTTQLDAEDDPVEVEESRPAPVTLFDQSLIDDKRVHYIQATANRTRDMFVVDVTNGISWLRGESTVITNLVIMRFKLYQVDQIL